MSNSGAKFLDGPELRGTMTVHVAMGNDYPAAVFATKKAADAFCETKRAEDAKRREHDRYKKRVHWRAYPFEVQP